MLSNLLSKVNSKNKEFVGVSLNTNGNLEIIQTSRIDKKVQKYTTRFVSYNPIKREIESYDALGAEIESGLTALGLNPKDCNIVLSMPNVLFGISDSVPEMITSVEEISGIITSEAEDASYILKTEEPAVSWLKMGTVGDYQRIAYTAIQDSVLRELKYTFESIGATLVSVQNTYATLIGGLSFAGRFEKYIPENTQYWNILLITGSSFSIFNFNESILENYYEEPLAVKSINQAEVYSEVASMASKALQNYNGSRVVIISDTDDISAEIMASKLGSDTWYIEQNKFQQNPIIEASYDILPNLAAQISITAVGTSVDYSGENSLKFNYLTTAEGFQTVETPDIIAIGGKSFELTRQKAINITIIAVVVVAVLFGAICVVFNTLGSQTRAEIKKFTSKEKALQEELKTYNHKPVKKSHISTAINLILDSNRKKMLYYDALSYGLPDKLWLEYFEVGNSGNVAISGVAMNSSDITAFLRGIREVSGESNISLTKLNVINEEDILNLEGQDLYSFQLSAGSAQINFEPEMTEEEVEQPETKKRNSMKNRNTPPASLPSLAPPVKILND